MAARKRKVTLTDDWKANIRAGVLMARLYDHALGEVEMSQSQIKAAQIVIGKVIPDVARTEHTGENGGAVNHSVTIQVVGVPANAG